TALRSGRRQRTDFLGSTLAPRRSSPAARSSCSPRCCAAPAGADARNIRRASKREPGRSQVGPRFRRLGLTSKNSTSTAASPAELIIHALAQIVHFSMVLYGGCRRALRKEQEWTFSYRFPAWPSTRT